MLAYRPVDWVNIMTDRRRALGLSQAELARQIGMSRQWVVGFETGTGEAATLRVLMRLADVLGLDVDVSVTVDD